MANLAWFAILSISSSLLVFSEALPSFVGCDFQSINSNTGFIAADGAVLPGMSSTPVQFFEDTNVIQNITYNSSENSYSVEYNSEGQLALFADILGAFSAGNNDCPATARTNVISPGVGTVTFSPSNNPSADIVFTACTVAGRAGQMMCNQATVVDGDSIIVGTPLIVFVAPGGGKEEEEDNTSKIIGGVIGGLFGLMLVVALLFINEKCACCNPKIAAANAHPQVQHQTASDASGFSGSETITIK